VSRSVTRLRVADAESDVLTQVGVFLARMAGQDLAQRCRDGLDHDGQSWADRKRALTAVSSARWAGSITKASHDQWGLSRRAQGAHLENLDQGIRMIRHRLSLPLDAKGNCGKPGGYLDAAGLTVPHLANAAHGRYQLGAPVAFAYRGAEWADRVHANRAVAYTISYDPARASWYLTAA
jgi:hypothetical protein